MKMSDVEATGSGGSRAEDSEARTQVAGYGARPHGARAGQIRPRYLVDAPWDQALAAGSETRRWYGRGPLT